MCEMIDIDGMAPQGVIGSSYYYEKVDEGSSRAMKRLRRGAPAARMTRQRRAILDILSREGWHPTGDEVYRLARRRLPRISLGTVYRNLELLSEQGLIRKIEVSGRQRRFDGRLEPHCHARCTVCGQVEDVMYRPQVSLEKAAAELKGWEISGHSLELTGRCPGCIAPVSDSDPRRTHWTAAESEPEERGGAAL